MPRRKKAAVEVEALPAQTQVNHSEAVQRKNTSMSIINLAGDIGSMEEFEPLPEGVYPAELQDIEIRNSEKVPNGYLYCQFRISPDYYPADYDAGNAPDGLTLVYSRVAIPDPKNRRTVRPFKMFLEALGVEISGAEFDPQDWIGREVNLIVKRNEYQGQPVNNVDAVTKIVRV